MLALAIELKHRGVAVTLAAAPIYRSKVESEGVAFATNYCARSQSNRTS
jgi:UDP:flavonoid glycosyltransferase YjiC (YdhE family)